MSDAQLLREIVTNYVNETNLTIIEEQLRKECKEKVRRLQQKTAPTD